MKKIIIQYEDVSEIEAITCVREVIDSGRVSENSKGIKHFCWATTFKNKFSLKKILVAVRTKRTEKSPDSFIVYKIKK